MNTLLRVSQRSLLVLISSFIFGVSAFAFAPAASAVAPSISQNVSYNWSGYVNTGHTFNKVQGDITVPTITCPVNGAETLFWVGFDGYSNSTAEQDGVGAKCNGSTPSYFAWWEMYNANTGTSLRQVPTSSLSVKPGDHVASTVSYVTVQKAGSKPYGAFQLTLDNATTKRFYSTTQTCAAGYTCSRNSAEWIAERYNYGGSSYSTLARWGYNSQLFTDAASTTTTNSKLEPVSANNTTELAMIENNTFVTLAAPAALNTGGTAFGVNWLATK